jgi:hypothetical protein
MIYFWYLLSRFAIVGVPLVMLVPYVSLMIYGTKRLVEPAPRIQFLALLILLAISGFSFLLNHQESALSFLYFILLYVPFLYVLRISRVKVVRNFIALCIFASLYAVLQLCISALLGGEIDFFLLLPESFSVDGYNYTYPVAYGAALYKPNGGFLEPSFLSQFLVLAMILEFNKEKRWWAFLILIAGVIVSLSGTGLLMLAAISPLVAVKLKWNKYLIASLSLLFVLLIWLPVGVWLEYMWARRLEFLSAESSAAIRYINPYIVLSEWLSNAGVLEFLFGGGAGTADGYSDRFRVVANIPAHIKLILEYGVVAFFIYCVSFYYVYLSVFRSYGFVFLLALILMLYVTSSTLLQGFSVVFLLIIYWSSKAKKEY